MNWIERIFRRKALGVPVTKSQKELLEIFLANKTEFDAWAAKQAQPKISFRFFYPSAIDFYYTEFKLFTAYFKKTAQGTPELTELKMTETNYHVIRCVSWRPFEETILEFLTTLEESKKIALFEKRKMLYEYEALCAKKPAEEGTPAEYAAVANSLLPR